MEYLLFGLSRFLVDLTDFEIEIFVDVCHALASFGIEVVVEFVEDTPLVDDGLRNLLDVAKLALWEVLYEMYRDVFELIADELEELQCGK